MMEAKDSIQLARYYEDVIVENPGWHLGWSPDGQRQVYRHAADHLNLAGRGILDVGCGFGGFRDFLNGRGTPYRYYMGVDGSRGVLRVARLRNPGADFRRIVWPYPTDRQKRWLAERQFDVAVILGVLYMVPLEESMLWLERAGELVSECMFFDWLVGGHINRLSEMCRSLGTVSEEINPAGRSWFTIRIKE